MKLIYNPKFFPRAFNMYKHLALNVPWVNKDAPRDECFMANETRVYTYGKGFTRSYTSVPFDANVLSIMKEINRIYKSSYDLCFLNCYKNHQQHLGWHSDDSPEVENSHPIAVVSFGAERYIYVKEKDYKGVIPDCDKYLLHDGSLFIMPARYQENHLHKIPKHDKPCGGRISLTFRKYKMEMDKLSQAFVDIEKIDISPKVFYWNGNKYNTVDGKVTCEPITEDNII